MKYLQLFRERIEPLLCPFCGSDRIQCIEEDAPKGHTFEGSQYLYSYCYRCGARGPWHWKTDEETDQECCDSTFKLWNERLDWITGEKIDGNSKP